MEQKEILLAPFGGINQDDSLISPPRGDNPFNKGDYRYARNARIGSSDQDNTGGAENFPSTLEISDYYEWNGSAWVTVSIPAGNNKCIGVREDFDEGAVYYSVYNSNGNHQILKFVKTERRIYELLKWSGLNFAITNVISIARVSTYLVVTCKSPGENDVVNPPRLINTANIYNLKYTLGSNFSEYHISLAKWPPLAPLTIRAVHFDYTGGNVMLNNGIFQFCYRYIYYGGMRSTWGPFSQFYSIENGLNDIQNVTKFQIIAPGYIYDYENKTYFGHDDVRFYSSVEFIEFAFRQSTIDTWKLFKRMPTGDFGDDSKFIYFDNNGPVATINPSEINQPFDVVPFESEACEVIDNRIQLGNNTDDFEIPEFEVENVEVAENTTFNEWSGDAVTAAIWTPYLGSPFASVLANKLRPFQNNFKERGVYKLAIQYQHWTGRKSLAISPDNWTYLIPTNDGATTTIKKEYALGFSIPSTIKPPDWAVGYQILRSNCLNIDFFIEGTANDFVLLSKASTSATPGETSQEVQTIINNFKNSKEELSTNNNRKELAHQIATNLRDEDVVGSLSDAGRIYIDISNWFLQTANGTSSNPGNNLYYSFFKGDRVRFLGVSNKPVTARKVFDLPIVDFDGKGLIIDKTDDMSIIFTRSVWGGTPELLQIEVYRPKPFATGDVITPIEYFEIGEWYPVTQPTTPSRDFLKRDWTWTDKGGVSTIAGSSSNALNFAWYSKLPIIQGDIFWNYKKLYHTKVGGLSSSFSGYFNQMTTDRKDAAGYWEHNDGRANVAYRYNPLNLEKTTQVRFSLKFLEDSIFTAINTFLESNQYIYPKEYGAIRSMRNTSNAQVESVGNILLISGEIETWSVYVNRSTLEDLSGRTQVSVSDRVLGSFNTLLGSHGTLNPESVSARNGRVIWWNAKKGVWVRYSLDGMTEISKEGMKNWFKDISLLIIDAYQTSTPPKVIAVYDDYHDEWITRIDHADLPDTFREYESYKCASFAERNADKRWKTIWDYAPDRFASLDNEVYSLIGSKVHIHEAGVNYGKIYGVAQPTQLELATGGRQTRDWRWVATIASDGWSFERIRGDWKSNAGTIQESRIPLTSLELKEGTYWAPIKRDKNSPNAGSETAGVVDGNPMKSKSLRLLMQLDPAVDYLSVFNWLSVGDSESLKNSKI